MTRAEVAPDTAAVYSAESADFPAGWLRRGTSVRVMSTTGTWATVAAPEGDSHGYRMRGSDLCVLPGTNTDSIAGRSASRPLIPDPVVGYFAREGLDVSAIIQIDSMVSTQTDRAGGAYAVTDYAVKYLVASGRVLQSRPMPGWYDEISVRTLVWEPLSGIGESGNGPSVWVDQRADSARRSLRVINIGGGGVPVVVYAGSSPVGIQIIGFVPSAGSEWIIGQCSNRTLRVSERSSTTFRNADISQALMSEGNQLCAIGQ